MAKKRQDFEGLFKKISLESQITKLRPTVLRDIFSTENRKRAAAALNRELTYFEETFIRSFIDTHFTVVQVADASPDQLSGSTITHWARLSHDWERKKRAKGLMTPAFFRYGVPRKPSPTRPKITLEAYLRTNWNTQTALRVVGRVEPEDIIFKTSKGEDVTLKKAKANPDAAFLGKLKTTSGDITNLKEKFTIGFRAFPKISVDRLQRNPREYNLFLAKKFIPLSENTAANGFALSKLTNNYSGGDSQITRPTVAPLLKWYYRVKLPHVFKQFYKTKGLVGR